MSYGHTCFAGGACPSSVDNIGRALDTLLDRCK